MWAGIFLQKEIICTCNSNILQIWSLFSLDAASFEAVFRARNIDQSKDNVQTEGEFTDQSFVLTVMFICYIRSYWKWSKLKFPYYSVVSVVISMQWVTGYCGTLIWNSGWNARKPRICLQFAHICATFNKILTAVEQNKMTGKIKYQRLSVRGKDLGRNKMYCMWWIVQ